MIINNDNLRTLYVGFSTAFREGLGQAAPMWNRIAMEIPSTTAENEYGWLESLPDMREWIGERYIRNLNTDGYRIRNRTFESTVAVPRERIEDDNLNLFGTRFREMGFAAAALPDRLVFDLLNAGFSSPCYDGQFFFDTDHPVKNADGVIVPQSNSGGGSGTPWFLMSTRRPMKPLIFQNRRPPELTEMVSMNDEGVFMRREYRYGVDTRCAAGFGYWEFAYGSRQTLDANAYAAARAAMIGRTGDGGRPLGIMPDLLVVPSTLEAAGRAIVQAQNNAAGASNIWFGTVELMVVPWLG